jgi:hypothetical protein
VAQRAQPVKIAIGIAYRAACRRGRKPEPAIIGNRAADASAPALRSEPDIATMNLISVDSNDTPVRYKVRLWTSSIVRTYHLDYMFYDEHFTLLSTI